jgi:hypothetical protein
MKKFLIPAIGAAFAFSPVIVPAMFGPAPAHAQAKAKAAKAKAKNPNCPPRVDDRYQASWADAYGCWGQKARLQPQPTFAAGPGFAPTPGFAPGPVFGPTAGAPGQPAAKQRRGKKKG